MLDILGYDFSKVSTACTQARIDMIPICFQSLGRDAAGHALRDPVETANICTAVPGAYLSSCVEGALRSIAEFHGPHMSGEPHALCNELSPEAASQCYMLLGRILPDFFGNNKERINSLCAFAKPEHQETCRNSAGVKSNTPLQSGEGL